MQTDPPEAHGKAYAVMSMNSAYGGREYDNDLIVNGGEEIFERNNGLLCCTVRGDLIRILAA